jgi:hypothetical protein
MVRGARAVAPELAEQARPLLELYRRGSVRRPELCRELARFGIDPCYWRAIVSSWSADGRLEDGRRR